MSQAVTPALSARIESARAVLRQLSAGHKNIVFANSMGAEDMVLTDLILKEFPGIGIFSLDTGRLPEETYALMQRLEEKYRYRIKLYYPDTAAIENFVRENGINAFYNSVEMRKECCRIRKVEPLKRALAGQDAWITGQRRSQSVTRTALEPVEYDHTFNLDKANPLYDWEEQDVWAYIRTCEVPYNALHDRHYPSIGCAPCTRAITKGEDIRAGRWWWENPESKECGLNPGTVSPLPRRG
ncbi:MAG TPA: phosphoadenylyl-sulfate reductase [Gammaproteobacteria bacterium]|nr:phosphoadenylyl-sulfate reductase [Gammaproteobacteria bacterium]